MSTRTIRRHWHKATIFLVGPVILYATQASAQEQAKLCSDRLVLREAFPGDRVCVSPQTNAQVLADNAAASSRIQPNAQWGDKACKAGFVWRVARPDDLVCVTPEIRAQTAADNAAQAAAASTAPVSASAPPPPPVPPKPAYRLGTWSPSKLQDGLTYRFRWGLDPAKPKVLDAIFEVRNGGTEKWVGSVRSADCSNGTLAATKPVTVAPGETQQVTFQTANCGDADVPFFKPGVARSVRFD